MYTKLSKFSSEKKLPSLREIKSALKGSWAGKFTKEILDIYIVGSYAKGTQNENSELLSFLRLEVKQVYNSQNNGTVNFQTKK